jgi:peroxiredoxin
MKRFAMGLAAAAFLATPAFAAIKVGAKAPDFTAPAYLAGEPFTYKLADALKKGPVVLFFFPAAHTPGCNIEAKMFSDAADSFKAQGASLVGVTAGNLKTLAGFSKETEHCGGKFPVAADTGTTIARKYDVVLAGRKIGGSEIPDRTSFVIAPDGTVLHAFSALTPDKHVDESMGAVKAWRAKHPLKKR